MSVIGILAWVTLQFYFTLVGMLNVIETLAETDDETAPGNSPILTAFALRRIKG